MARGTWSAAVAAGNRFGVTGTEREGNWYDPQPDVGRTVRPDHRDRRGRDHYRGRRGFRYLSPGSELVRNEATLRRIKALVIPPAWEDVWVSPDPAGHIQAVGTDAAGRRQYRYHDQWREEQDQRKYGWCSSARSCRGSGRPSWTASTAKACAATACWRPRSVLST